MHSFVIPRAVNVLAGGVYAGRTDDTGRVILDVSAKTDDAKWPIIQSSFMRENAKTTSFDMELVVGGGHLEYTQTTMLDIYGKSFEHTDRNVLKLVGTG